jgi:predicted dehydrogenase
VTVLHPSDENQTSGLSIRRGGDVDPDALRLAQEENRLEVAGAMQGCSSTDAALVRNVLFGSVCHEVALLRALLPESEFSVNSAIADAPAAQRTEPPRLQITGTTSQGPRWSLSWNWVPDYPSYQEWVELVGDKGSLRIDMPAPYGGIPSAVLTSFTGSASGATEQVWTPTTLDAFHTELEEFARAVSTGSPVTATASGAAKDAELLLNIADVLAASDLA